jgi:hypothetical protein
LATATVRIDSKFADMVRIISASRKQSSADYMTSRLGPIIRGDYDKLAASMAKSGKGKTNS